MSHLYVGVTDGDWFRFLRSRPEVVEVNFWKPRALVFHQLVPGELFLFKLHAKDGGRIAGGGYFVRSAKLPAWLAWKAFGEGNGAASFNAMRESISAYRGAPISASGIEEIGCIALEDVFFLDEEQWIDPPERWSNPRLAGLAFALEDPIAIRLLADVQMRRTGALLADALQPPHRAIAWATVTTRLRRGQGAFTTSVIAAYDGRCAVSGEAALPALEAAHIYPVTDSRSSHDVRNGILLRSDIHGLFDRGYVTITPDGHFLASDRLADEFHNGEPYRQLARQERVHFPRAAPDRPLQEALDWHYSEVFLR